jgi:hypothetical protein
VVADPQPFNIPDPANAQYCTVPTTVQKVKERVAFSMKVGESGTYTWWMNPSTRPFELKAGRTEAYTLTCEVGGKAVHTQKVTVARGQTLAVENTCGA